MKQRRPPFWLFCDFLSWVMVCITWQAFGRMCRDLAIALTAESHRRMKPAEIDLGARLLAEAETWMRFAIQRRAFRLAGLKHARVCPQPRSLASTDRAFLARTRQLIYTYDNLDRLARQTASRLRATTTIVQQHSNPARPNVSARAVIASATRSRRPGAARRLLPTTIATTSTRAGMRVRAPPWRPLFATPHSPFPSTALPQRTPRHAPNANGPDCSGPSTLSLASQTSIIPRGGLRP